MDRKIDSGCKILDDFCGSIILMIKLNLVKGNAAYESDVAANGTAPDKDYNHGTTVIK